MILVYLSSIELNAREMTAKAFKMLTGKRKFDKLGRFVKPFDTPLIYLTEIWDSALDFPARGPYKIKIRYICFRFTMIMHI